MSQKNSNTYIFKFDSEVTKNEVLSKGTWYVGQKPLVVTAWGVSATSDKVKNIPMWVKISGIPDSYWTQKGLIRLVNVVGKPLCADQLTSKLEVLPFAKFCMNFELGKSLPNSVKVVTLDRVSKEHITSDVLFSYPNKSLMCNGCCSLGHTVGACPNVSRSWVQKVKPPVEPIIPEDAASPGPVVNVEKHSTEDTFAPQVDNSNMEGWKTVAGRKSIRTSNPLSSGSNVKLPYFKSISCALSKNQIRGQKKRASKARGRSSPS